MVPPRSQFSIKNEEFDWPLINYDKDFWMRSSIIHTQCLGTDDTVLLVTILLELQ